MIRATAKRFYPRRRDYRQRQRFRDFLLAVLFTLALALVFALIALFFALHHF